MKKLFCLIIVLFFSMGLFAQVSTSPRLKPHHTRVLPPIILNGASPSIKRPPGTMIISSNPSKCNVTLQRFFKSLSMSDSHKPETIIKNAGEEITCESPTVLNLVSGYYIIKFEHDGYTPIIDVIQVLPRDTVRYEGKLVKKNK